MVPPPAAVLGRRKGEGGGGGNPSVTSAPSWPIVSAMLAARKAASWLALLHVTQCMVLHRPRITPGRAMPVKLCAPRAPGDSKGRGGMKRRLMAVSSVKTEAQLKVLRSALTSTLMFRGLDEPSIDRMMQSMVRLEVRMLLSALD